MSGKRKIAEVAIARLTIYNRALGKIEKQRVEIISSNELGDRTGYSAAQIRRDLILWLFLITTFPRLERNGKI